MRFLIRGFIGIGRGFFWGRRHDEFQSRKLCRHCGERAVERQGRVHPRRRTAKAGSLSSVVARRWHMVEMSVAEALSLLKRLPMALCHSGVLVRRLLILFNLRLVRHGFLLHMHLGVRHRGIVFVSYFCIHHSGFYFLFSGR